MVSTASEARASAASAPRLRGSLARLRRSTTLRAIGGAQLVALAIILLRTYGWLQPPELAVYDALRVAWAGHQRANRVVLVGVTDGDITAADGARWPWPLPDDKLAQILERLASWRPQAIGVDIYRDIPIYRDVPTGGEDPLAAVLRRHPEIYWVFRLKGDSRHPGTAAPKVLRGSDRTALSDIPEDSDGIVRRGLLYADDGKNQYAGLATALALAYLAPRHIAPESAGGDALRLGKAVIAPLDETRGPYVQLDSRGYQVLMDYRGGPQPFPEASLSAIMDHDDFARQVRGHIVILGVDADSVKDAFGTPYSTGFNGNDAVSGIAMHAHLADQLLREAIDGDAVLDGLSRQHEDLWIWGWALLGALLGLVLRSTVPAVIGTGGGLIMIALLAYLAFGWALWLPAVPAGLAWAGAAGLTNRLLHTASNRARSRLRKSFEHYLPPAVIAEMVASETLPALGGERREISVLFTDVAGFTTFSEERDPVELAHITNAYFDGVCAAILAHGGYANAFLGDGVLAFFGAPVAQSDHADRAIGAAFDIARFTDGFSAAQHAQGVAFGHTRIGVHSGLAFVGNVGARERLQYTALGDVLNTASRLEGLNKAIGSRICVSREVVEKSRRYRFRPVGHFIVKGRRDATEVFLPVDPERQPAQRVAQYEGAFRALREGGADALATFAALHQEDPDDPCVAFHYQRLRAGESGTIIEMHEK